MVKLRAGRLASCGWGSLLGGYGPRAMNILALGPCYSNTASASFSPRLPPHRSHCSRSVLPKRYVLFTLAGSTWWSKEMKKINFPIDFPSCIQPLKFWEREKKNVSFKKKCFLVNIIFSVHITHNCNLHKSYVIYF